MKRSFKPYLYMVLGALVGFVVGGLAYIVIGGLSGGLLSPLGIDLSWGPSLAGVLPVGLVILGAVRGYQVGLQQAEWDTENAREHHGEGE